MKNKSILIGVLVFCAGGGAGYILGIKRVKSQYQSDLAEVKDFYAAKLEEMGVQRAGFDPDESEKESKNEEGYDEEISEEYFNKISGYSSAATGQRDKKGRPITNYNKPPLELVAKEALGEPAPDDDDENTEEVHDEEYEAELDARAEELAKQRYENQSNGRPYVINHDEYEDAPENYTRNVLYYYLEDRTLCEDDDTVVDDEEELIGLDYEDTLDMQTTAWVRNDALMNVYQIHRIDASYLKTVANIMETPRERDFRIIGRRKQGFDS